MCPASDSPWTVAMELDNNDATDFFSDSIPSSGPLNSNSFNSFDHDFNYSDIT